MKSHYTIEEARAAGILPPLKSGGGQSSAKPAIRMPAPVKMSKPEAEYERILKIEFPMFEVRYEAITLKLPGGNYTTDFVVMNANRIILMVEVKGSFRLGSAGRSHMAFKAAVAAWPHIRFRFAQRDKLGDWRTVESNP